MTKKPLIKSLHILHSNFKGKTRWSASAELNCDEFLVAIPSKYYQSLDGAVSGIKESIIKACDKFHLDKSKLYV